MYHRASDEPRKTVGEGVLRSSSDDDTRLNGPGMIKCVFRVPKSKDASKKKKEHTRSVNWTNLSVLKYKFSYLFFF